MLIDDYTILSAAPEHVGALAEVERRAGARFGSSVPEQVLTRTIPLAVLEDAQRAGLLWVALTSGGEPVGFALAQSVGGRAHLEELDVLPEHGRRGIGAALVSAVERWALFQGLTELTLTTYLEYPWNADYYSKLGFERIAAGDLDVDMRRRLVDEDALGLERDRRVAMRKHLTAGQRPPMPRPDRRSLLAYVLIAYAVTWALWIPPLVYSASSGWPLPSIGQGSAWAALTPLQFGMAVCFQLAVYGPAVAALVVLLRGRDRGALRSWARSVVRLRVAPGWYAFVLLAPLALAALVTAVSLAMGAELVVAGIPALGALAVMAITQILTSGMEEPGWRGFALPLLQRTHSAENASWYLGLIWAGWHLPYVLYLYRELPLWQLPLILAGFTMSIVAMGYVHAWLHNSAESTAMNVILHGWANATNVVVAATVLSPVVPLVTAGMTWLFVAWLFWRYGKQTLRTASGRNAPYEPLRHSTPR